MPSDGIPPLKTSFMYNPYPDDTHGVLETEGNTIDEQETNLRDIIKLVHANRMQIGIHSTGERAIDIITDQYMKCIDADPWDARHYVIHSDFTLPETINRVGEFNKNSKYHIAFNVQSSTKWTRTTYHDSGSITDLYYQLCLARS